MRPIAYLDHNATSPLRPAAFDAMAEALRAGGNPSSVHASGRRARAIVDKARREVATLAGAEPSEIVFTSGGTEANNLALSGAGRRRVLISAVEHDSVRRAVPQAEVLPVDGEGVLDLAALERALAASAEPVVVSVMLANNETGVLQPIAEVCASRGVLAPWCIAMPFRAPARCLSVCAILASTISAFPPTRLAGRRGWEPSWYARARR